MSSPKTTYLFPFVLIGCIITLGTTGYILIEGWGFLDALYMTIITLTTVGFREIHVLSDRGIVFTIVLIVGGVGTVLYALSTGAKVLMEGEIQEALGRKRLEKRIRELRDHYIICGFGRMGKIISRELRENNIHFVAVEKDPEVTQEHQNILMMAGDATKDEVLKEAGIERA
ncbi:MAG TPA: NAD-binding protein, partial [Dissulfurispiraceae bacterium]|nr:NAD-binding protein [Dissulfurispiraceae bacterium]